MRNTRAGCGDRLHVVHAFLLLAFVDTGTSSNVTVNGLPGNTNKVSKRFEQTSQLINIDYRLPTDVQPIRYNLKLTLQMAGPDTSKFMVKGYMEIMFKCRVVTNTLTLHVKNVTVDRGTFRYAAEGLSYPTKTVYDKFEVVEERELLIITLKEFLSCGVKYWLKMTFTSPIGNTPEGIFYGSYQTQGRTQYFVATKFEPIHARKVFPCFDDPQMKAIFQLTILRPIDTISIANTGLARTDKNIPEDGFRYDKDIFKETPLISTYTLAFFVGKFSKWSTESKNYSGKVGVYYREQSPEFSRYVGDLTVKLNTFFVPYFHSGINLDKQDFVALPYSVQSPNLGLNMYSESLLQYNERYQSEEDKELVARTVSYATARRWSSAMVSPDRWSYLWLVEGLAGYFEDAGIDSVESQWKTWHKFVLEKLHVALQKDSSVSSRPMHWEVEKPEAIKNLYDWVAYKKAPSVVRMVSFFVGPETFNRAIKFYFEALALKEARFDTIFPSLIEHLQAANSSLMNLKDVIEPWIRQMNYPLVNVIRDFNDKDIVHVTQKRFLSEPNAKDPGNYNSPYNYRWTIPLTFTSSQELDFDKDHNDVYWINKEDRFVTLKLNVPLPDRDDADGWILANVKQYGYYRVNYQIGNWMALSKQLKNNHAKIDTINRAQIINDAWNLARANYLPLEIALSTIEYLNKERDYMPWYAAWVELKALDFVLAYHKLHAAFDVFIINITAGALTEFGLLTDLKDHMQIYTRNLVADLACYSGAKECKDKALREYRNWMRTRVNRIPMNVRKTVYCHAIARGKPAEWNAALEQLKKAKYDSEKNILLHAMACSTEKQSLIRLLNMLLDHYFVLNERQALGVITSLLQNRFGRQEVWHFYRSNYKILQAKFPALKCSKLLPTFVEGFNTVTELGRVKTFITTDCPELRNTDIENQCLDKVQTNIDWVKKNLPIIEKWLRENGYTIN